MLSNLKFGICTVLIMLITVSSVCAAPTNSNYNALAPSSKVSSATYTRGNTEHQYCVHFAANGGSGTMQDQWITYGQTNPSLHSCTFTSPSSLYVFGGWFTDAACTSAFTVPTTWNIDHDLTLYAKWKSTVYLRFTAINLGDGKTVWADLKGDGNWIQAQYYGVYDCIPGRTRFKATSPYGTNTRFHYINGNQVFLNRGRTSIFTVPSNASGGVDLWISSGSGTGKDPGWWFHPYGVEDGASQWSISASNFTITN